MSEAMVVLLIFLAFVALLTLLVKGFATIMGRLAGADVRQCHEAAEYIIATGEIPRHWLDGEARHAGWLSCMRRADPPHHQIIERLTGLIEHFEGSPLVADESTRQLLLSQLRATRGRWLDGQSGVEEKELVVQ